MRLRRLFPPVVFAAVFLALFSAAAEADKRYLSGTLASPSADAGGPGALFRVEIAAAQSLSVELHATAFDPMLEVVGPGGAYAFNDDAEGLDARIDLPRAEAGTWYVAVLDFGGSGGAFLLAVEGASDVAEISADRVPPEVLAQFDAHRSDRLDVASAMIGGAYIGRYSEQAAVALDGGPGAMIGGSAGMTGAEPPDRLASDAGITALSDRGVVAAANGGGQAAMPPPSTAPIPFETDAVSAGVGDVAPVPGTIQTDAGRVLLPSTALTPLFPWPPPRPSGWNVLPDDLFDLSAEATYADIDRRLRSALSTVGHDDVGYYWIPDGFAIVTRLERFEEDGSTVADNSRWTATVPAAPLTWNLIDYIRALTTAQTGYFRVIVFAVTPQPFSTEPSDHTLDAVEAWAAGGANTLPTAILARNVPQGTKITALVYEFRKVRGGEGVTALDPSHMPIGEQLRRLGLIAAMRAER